MLFFGIDVSCSYCCAFALITLCGDTSISSGCQLVLNSRIVMMVDFIKNNGSASLFRPRPHISNGVWHAGTKQ